MNSVHNRIGSVQGHREPGQSCKPKKGSEAPSGLRYVIYSGVTPQLQFTPPGLSGYCIRTLWSDNSMKVVVYILMDEDTITHVYRSYIYRHI